MILVEIEYFAIATEFKKLDCRAKESFVVVASVDEHLLFNQGSLVPAPARSWNAVDFHLRPAE